MKRRAVLLTYRPPSKKASIAWLVVVMCTIGAALLAVMIAAQAASAHPGHEPSAGWFQRCSLAKTGKFDPIVYPNTPPPVGHRHLFFGSTAISYQSSSASDLQAGSSTSSTCLFEAGTKAATAFPEFGANGGNFSSYWIPDLKLRNGNYASGAQINAYYRKGASSVDAHVIEPFPSGLKMLIRDRNNRQTQVSWFCSGLSGEGNNGKFAARPYDCIPDGPYKYVTARITFPQCGTSNYATDSRDHISHMAYAGDRGCPSTHPRVFPRLFITAKYDTSRGARSRLADGSDPATGFHADYMEGWQRDDSDDTLEFFVNACIRGGINCRDGDRLP